MEKFMHRILFAALMSSLLLPFSAQAQQQDQGSNASTQPQTSQSQNAQPNGSRRGRMAAERQHMAMLAQKLNLTDAQKEQFQQIGRDTRKQAMTIRQDSTLNEGQKREKITALRKQSHQQMFSVLTPEQKEQLKQMREQRQKEQQQEASPSGDQASAKQKTSAPAAEDDDPFAGMTSDDDPGNGGF
jgi:Spy/CpxP family protein refolding chaperone